MRYLIVILAAAAYAQTAKVTAPVKHDVALSDATKQAVSLSGKWTDGDDHPAAGPDGRVVYSFGGGLPVVVCAPLKVCVIELQEGEKIAGVPHLGDSVRWNITPAVYGAGSSETNVIVIKPQEAGLDTDLMITTDRRAYYIRLISKEKDYIARTAFRYPDEDSAARWNQRLAEQRAAEVRERVVIEKQPERTVMLPAVATAESLNFGYAVTGKASFRPSRVYDDGSKTFLRMPPGVGNREAPVLLVVGADGKSEVTNYRVVDLTYIVDRLFDHATLQLGRGKKAEKVEIVRDAKERS